MKPEPESSRRRNLVVDAITAEEESLVKLQRELKTVEARLDGLKQELVSLDGDVSASPVQPVVNDSATPATAREKIKLFRSLFRGREDLYPKICVSGSVFREPCVYRRGPASPYAGRRGRASGPSSGSEVVPSRSSVSCRWTSARNCHRKGGEDRTSPSPSRDSRSSRGSPVGLGATERRSPTRPPRTLATSICHRRPCAR